MFGIAQFSSIASILTPTRMKGQGSLIQRAFSMPGHNLQGQERGSYYETSDPGLPYGLDGWSARHPWEPKSGLSEEPEASRRTWQRHGNRGRIRRRSVDGDRFACRRLRILLRLILGTRPWRLRGTGSDEQTKEEQTKRSRR